MLRLLLNFLRYQISYRRGPVYRRFMMVPAIISRSVWAMSWVATASYWAFDRDVSLYSVAVYIALCVCLFMSLAPLTSYLFAFLSGERMWLWGKSRFANRQHFFNWLQSVGNEDFETIIMVDERIERQSPFIKLMRP